MARRAGLCEPWPGEAAVAMLAVAGGAAGETPGPAGDLGGLLCTWMVAPYPYALRDCGRHWGAMSWVPQPGQVGIGKGPVDVARATMCV